MFNYAGVVLESFEPGIHENSECFESSVTWISTSFRFNRNYCFVDEKPDNFSGFHDRTYLGSILNSAHP